jgi:hypothetical protein
MNDSKNKRKSHCLVCGVRLSEKTSSGKIRWRPSHVDDEGIYCKSCYKPDNDSRDRKRTEK